MDYLYKEGKIDNFQFGIMLSTDDSYDSMITFGGYVSTNYEGEIYAHDVAGSFHWSLNLISYSYNDSTITPSVSKALIDTGTSILVISESKNIYKAEFE